MSEGARARALSAFFIPRAARPRGARRAFGTVMLTSISEAVSLFDSLAMAARLRWRTRAAAVSYTHLRAHETDS